MSSFVRTFLALAAVLALGGWSSAQDIPGHRPPEAETPAAREAGPSRSVVPGSPPADPDDTVQRWHTQVELALTIGTLVFGAFVLALLGWFLGKGLLPADSFLKLFVLVIVVTAGLFVVVAGYTQDQIAPMMGLLGTLVGYLLGREASKAAAKSHEGST